MNDDSNPNPQPSSVSLSSEEGLAQALEDLVSNAPFRISAQLNKSASFTSSWAGPCPDAGDWLLFAGGELSPAKGQALLTHAALCTNCLNRLREAQRVLSPEAPPEELEDLKQFASTSSTWQRRLALQLAQTSHGKGGAGRFRQFFWAAGSMAAALVLAIGGLLWWGRANAPEKLIAQAYTQSRTFDLRVPGAGFAPVSPPMHLRGGSADNEPASLLSARAAIERKLQQSPNDAHLLQMQARADVLEERYDNAIDILDRLLAAGPVTSSLLLDDGMAYYLRGAATGSENDRATALDNLRRADELAPNDPVILFNEAIVMEDRGQVMNAVETWNRFVQFETDSKWKQEGQQRLQSLEEKLNRMKSHESRMEQHLATPQSMRALAADPVTLAGIDEEFSTTFLPRLLDAAYPIPGDRSRGSPCDDRCSAARSLLDALAASLQQNHQDSWLKEFLPADSSHIPNNFSPAAHALGQVIDANTSGDYAGAQAASLQSIDLFRTLNSAAGADRAAVERAYAEQRLFAWDRCRQDAESVLGQHNEFTWIHAQAASLAAGCDLGPGSASMNNPRFAEAFQLAKANHYLLLELRARTGMASWAFQSGDNEDAWRLMLEAIHCFYAGDFPPFRVGTFAASLAMVEANSPRVYLSLLLSREEVSLFELSKNQTLITTARSHLIRAALRSGALHEAQEQMNLEKVEASQLPGSGFPREYRAENELGVADVYLDRHDLTDAARQLDAAQAHLSGEDNWLQQANYAVERGELELALGHPEVAESTLREAILTAELRSRGAGPSSIVSARQDRDLYATLAGVWLAENRPGKDILALWERYRLRVLGKPVPTCDRERLDCLAPAVERALGEYFPANEKRLLIGQVVLRDRTLLYRADSQDVAWSESPIHAPDLFSAATALDHVASTPTSSQASIDQASRRVGQLLLDDGRLVPDPTQSLLIETDPLLGNLPWPAVATAQGPIGLRFDLGEVPSLLFEDGSRPRSAPGRSLVVGASIAAGESQPLPEALNEARIVAKDGVNPSLLLAAQATASSVALHVSTAPLIHFAGHAAQYGGQTRLLLAPSGQAGDKPYIDESLFRHDPPRAARLIVFSACSTGKREEGWNHGMGDIVDTLASLGVPEVVATRWQIDSAAAVPMMSAFYGGLSAGLSVPQALTAARQSLIRNARYRHPYYWAAYYASGVGTTDLREVLHGSN